MSIIFWLGVFAIVVGFGVPVLTALSVWFLSKYGSTKQKLLIDMEGLTWYRVLIFNRYNLLGIVGLIVVLNI